MPTDFQIEYSPTESTTCPYCHTQIAQQETAMRCAECDFVYHQSCWAELDKCGLFGCEETVAHAVSHRTISGDGSQSRWLAIPDEVIRVDSTLDPISQPTQAKHFLSVVALIVMFGFQGFMLTFWDPPGIGLILYILIIMLIIVGPPFFLFSFLIFLDRRLEK